MRPTTTRDAMSPRPLALVVLAATAVLPWLPVPEYVVTIADMAGIAALVALGLVMLTGIGGMTSFAQAVFVGFGAYTTAVLTTTWGWSPWATLLPSLVVTALGALVIGLVTVRLSGHYLALGTVAWAVAFSYLFGSLPLLGQHTGLSAIPPIALAGVPLIDPRRFYGLVWIAVVGSTVLTLHLLDSRVGRAIRALRGNGDAAASFGVDAAKARLWLFVYAALLAGLAGWLLAHFQRSVSPSMFDIHAGVEYLLMAVLGGTGQVFGALVGALIVVILREQLQIWLPLVLGQSGNFEIVVFGTILLAVLVGARDGLWPLIARWLPARPPRRIDRTLAMSRAAMPARDTLLLEADGLVRRFGGLIAVNGVSLALRAGTTTGLIGPNGAGKSTTFNLLTGTLARSAGTVRVLAKKIADLTPQTAARLRISRTFQHVKLVGSMSVLDNVAIGAHLRGKRGPFSAMLRLDRVEERTLLAEAARQIERVGLGEFIDRRADSLSLGQLRLVEIARALALDPILMLLDEPAAGLRFHEKAALATLLRQLNGDGMTVLIVEHDMDFVMNLVDRLVVLDFGAAIAEGLPHEIRRDAAVQAAYLGVAA